MMSDDEIISLYGLNNHVPSWSSSPFQERIMRFGREANKYGKGFDPRSSNCETLIRKSFVDDMIEFIRHNEHLPLNTLRRWISSRY